MDPTMNKVLEILFIQQLPRKKLLVTTSGIIVGTLMMSMKIIFGFLCTIRWICLYGKGALRPIIYIIPYSKVLALCSLSAL
jgi:hypothetical protein